VALAELSEGKRTDTRLFAQLTGSEQLWWRCCRDAAQVRPDWLAGEDHRRALKLIGDMELLDSGQAVSRAAKAADLACRALTAPPGADVGHAWDGALAVLPPPDEARFARAAAVASAVPQLRDRLGEVLDRLSCAATDGGQAMAAVCALLLAAAHPDRGRAVSVRVVCVPVGGRPSPGVTGTLELREFPPGPPGLFPDPRAMRDRRGNAAFAAAPRLAWRFAAAGGGGRRCVLWRLTFDGSAPDYAIDGGSLGAAFAIALRELNRIPRGRRTGVLAASRAFFIGPRPHRAITGVLATERPMAREPRARRDARGPWLGGVGDIDIKLKAASAKGLRLIAPAPDRKPGASGVDWAQTIHQADRYARRVRPVRTAVAAVAAVVVAGALAATGAVLQAQSATGKANARTAQQHAVSLSLQLAADSLTANNDGAPWTARQLAVAAWSVSHTGQAAAVLTTLLAQQQENGTIYASDGFVEGVAFSPAAELLATGDDEGKVRFWNSSTGQPVGRPVTASGHWVDGVAFNAGGTLLATADDRDGAARLWNPATGKPVGSPLTVPGSLMRQVTFRPDGELATAYDASDGDGVVQLWDPATGKPVAAAPLVDVGHNVGINGISFSPDGKVLVTADSDGTARFWDLATGRAVGPVLTASAGPMTGAAFSPDGTLVATVAGGDVTFWNPATGRPVGPPVNVNDRDGVNGVTFSPDGSLVAVAGGDGAVRLWGVASRKPAPFPPPIGGADASGVMAVAFSRDGTLATAGSDGTVRLWDTATGRPAGPALTAPGGAKLTSVAFNGDGTLLAAAGSDGLVRLWDPATGRPAGAALPARTYGPNAIAFSPDGKILATADSDGKARLWDPATGGIVRTLSAPMLPGSGMTAVAFSPDGRLLASAESDGIARVWDPATGRLIRTITVGGGIRARGNGIAFNPSGTLLAVAHQRGGVWLGDPVTGRLSGFSPPGNSTGMYRVAFSPAGPVLAISDADGVVQLWNWATGQATGYPLHAGTDVNGYVGGIAFSPDGTLLATADGDGTVRLWDTAPLTDPCAAVFVDTGLPASAQQTWKADAKGEPLPAACR
jgi:WD40 repeat protein